MCPQVSNTVQKWEKISWDKFKKLCQNKNLYAYETEADFGKVSPEIHEYYHAAINHHTLVLNLYTCVYSGYPRPCPYIKLSMVDSNQKSLDSSQCNFVRVGLVFLFTLIFLICFQSSNLRFLVKTLTYKQISNINGLIILYILNLSLLSKCFMLYLIF